MDKTVLQLLKKGLWPGLYLRDINVNRYQDLTTQGKESCPGLEVLLSLEKFDSAEDVHALDGCRGTKQLLKTLGD